MTRRGSTTWSEDAIPAELRTAQRWVAWHYVERESGPTKEPVDVQTRVCASSTDPRTWCDYGGVAAYARQHDSGVGYMLGDGWAGVDLDGVRDPRTGALTADAQCIITMLASYTEVSPSGGGLHIICRGTLPAGRRRRGWIEMYDSARYLCVTGFHVPGTPPIVAERTAELAAVHRRWLSDPPMPRPTGRPRPLRAARGRDVVATARHRYGERFARLWTGDWSAYGSPSEADLALCNMLARCGADTSTIASAVASSGLARGKWQRADYRERTIALALASAEQFRRDGARFGAAVARGLGL